MKKTNVTILLTMLLSMFGAKAYAYDIAVKNADDVLIYYNYINDGNELEVSSKGSNSYSGNVFIPKSITYNGETLRVTKIGGYAFSECRDLTSVTIPNGVTIIGVVAFYRCEWLTSITIPNSVTRIEDSAFYECRRLSTVTIGNSVTSIGFQAFRTCTRLTSITIPNSVTNIGERAFNECYYLNSVSMGNNVTCIGDYAFYGCSELTSITIPNSVTSIGEKAFYNCDLTEVTSMIENLFPINTNTFDDNTFHNAPLIVPKGTIDKYKATEGWKEFVYIEEELPSCITYEESERTNELKRYTIDGKAIKYSYKGINIIQKNNGTIQKVLVK